MDEAAASDKAAARRSAITRRRVGPGLGAARVGPAARTRAARRTCARLALAAVVTAAVAGPAPSPAAAPTEAVAPAVTPEVTPPSPPAAALPSRPGTGLLRPHVVTYRVHFRGMAGGDLTLALRTDPASEGWIYETRANPSFLARLVVSDASTEKGWFDVSGTGAVQPRRYLLDDGTRATNRDATLEFDWQAGRVKGFARGGPIDLPLPSGTQDTMSIRAALVADLQAGREPGTIPIFDGGRIREYVHRRDGTARIPTALGELDTVVYTSVRRGADARARTWQYWFAPSLGHLPVRIEQRAESEVRLTFEVRSLAWH